MMNYVIFELIILAMAVSSPGMESGKFELYNTESNEVIMIRFEEGEGGFEDEYHKVSVTNVFATENSKTSRMMTVVMVDNALYEVKMGKEEPFYIDLAPYFTELEWGEVFNKKQTIPDSNGDKLFFAPSGKTLVIESKSSNIKIKIPVN